MSSQPVPFPAQAKVIRLSVTAAGSGPAVLLPAAANQARIVNHGSDAYLAFSDTQAAAVATVPSAVPSITSCPSLGGSDIIQTIPNSTAQWVSAILDVGASGTVFIDVAIGEGV